MPILFLTHAIALQLQPLPENGLDEGFEENGLVEGLDETEIEVNAKKKIKLNKKHV